MIGTFAGARDETGTLGGHFSLGAEGGAWKAPGFVLPAEALAPDDAAP